MDRSFVDILDLLTPDDLLVVNDTRVMNARVHAVKDSGGRAEILVDRIVDDDKALCQVGVSKPLRDQHTLVCGDQQILVLERQGEFYLLQFPTNVNEFLESYGEVPLPPYIRRKPKKSDETRYQTIYADELGAVAAPTAGLHFDEDLLGLIETKGVQIAKVTLHVGSGTFSPIRCDLVSDHIMHSERYAIPDETLSLLETGHRRVVAVGTTVVRALESWRKTGETQGETDLFIQPGFQFKAVDALITNFHLPESSLLVLLSAFVGRERILATYQHAIEKRYRFFSFGDAMFCERTRV